MTVANPSRAFPAPAPSPSCTRPCVSQLLSLTACLAQVDFVDDIAKIMSADDSIPNADAMQTLIRLIGETSTPLGATEQELLRTTLMATAEKPLLESFSHSPALIKVAEWLAASLQQDVTLAWLALLGHMPMTIKALTDSGVGKVVNKLRK